MRRARRGCAPRASHPKTAEAGRFGAPIARTTPPHATVCDPGHTWTELPKRTTDEFDRWPLISRLRTAYDGRPAGTKTMQCRARGQGMSFTARGPDASRAGRQVLSWVGPTGHFLIRRFRCRDAGPACAATTPSPGRSGLRKPHPGGLGHRGTTRRARAARPSPRRFAARVVRDDCCRGAGPRTDRTAPRAALLQPSAAVTSQKPRRSAFTELYPALQAADRT